MDADEKRCLAARPDTATPERGLLARCENDQEGVPCHGRLRYRWGQSEAACDTCGGRCGIAVAAWERVDVPDGEAMAGRTPQPTPPASDLQAAPELGVHGLCQSCDRPYSPWHDSTAPGPTVRHPFKAAPLRPAGDAVSTPHNIYRYGDRWSLTASPGRFIRVGCRVEPSGAAWVVTAADARALAAALLELAHLADQSAPSDPTGDTVIPREDEWYPRECEFCTREAALACRDPYCREQRHGEPWEDSDPQEDR